jgi:sugar-specific transcriptional regulator TrmB
MKDILRLIGLTNEEIDTYLLLLVEKNVKATDIAKKLGVARSSAYNWLNSLIMKGFATEVFTNKIRYFQPVEPNLIPSLLEERADSIKKIIPDLKKIQNLENEGETKISLFKGNEGMKMVMNDILHTGKPYTCFGEIEKYFQDLALFTQNWMRKAEELNLKGRLISSKKQNFLVGKNEEVRYIANNEIPEITTVTFGSKTALFIWSTIPSVVLIEDVSVTKRELKLFENYWRKEKI